MPLNRHIEETLRLSHELMALSEAGEAEAQDDGCRILYGIVRDCAHKMRSVAQRELEKHGYPGGPMAHDPF